VAHHAALLVLLLGHAPLPPSPEFTELELVKRSRLAENGVAAMAFVRLRVA